MNFLGWERGGRGLAPPYSRSTGIINLAEKREEVQGRQQLAGKILRNKDLAAFSRNWRTLSQA